MEKIKTFFSNKVTRITCVILCCLSAAGLIIGGFTLDDLNGIVAGIGGIITAISALIIFIGSLINKKKEIK